MFEKILFTVLCLCGGLALWNYKGNPPEILSLSADTLSTLMWVVVVMGVLEIILLLARIFSGKDARDLRG